MPCSSTLRIERDQVHVERPRYHSHSAERAGLARKVARLRPLIVVKG
ncbi:MAG TPA: hypothetical protein VII06_26065 [Chloroflexota bacterium]